MAIELYPPIQIPSKNRPKRKRNVFLEIMVQNVPISPIIDKVIIQYLRPYLLANFPYINEPKAATKFGNEFARFVYS